MNNFSNRPSWPCRTEFVVGRGRCVAAQSKEHNSAMYGNSTAPFLSLVTTLYRQLVMNDPLSTVCLKKTSNQRSNGKRQSNKALSPALLLGRRGVLLRIVFLLLGIIVPPNPIVGTVALVSNGESM